MINNFTFEQLVLEPLTYRECEILDLISKGYSIAGIAKNLKNKNGKNISKKTVKNHVDNLTEKLNMNWPNKGAKYVRLTLIWQNYKNEIIEFSNLFKEKGQK